VSKGESNDQSVRIGRANTLFGLIRRKGSGLAWSGHDDAGDFSVETPALSGEAARVVGDNALPLIPLGALSQGPALLPMVVRRGFALLQTMTDEQKRIFVVKADGTSTLLFTSQRGFAWPQLGPRGDVAVLGGDEGRLELLLLNADGQVVARRWLLAPEGLLLFDAVAPSAPYVAVPAGPRGVELFSLVRGSPSRLLSLNLKGPFAECTKPAAPGSFVTLVGGFDGPRIDVGGHRSEPLVYPTHWATPSTAQGVVEVNGTSGCYRGVVMSDPYPLELHATGPGQMSGSLIGPEGTHRVDCRRAPPPRNPP
jgi:hypothetical protein